MKLVTYDSGDGIARSGALIEDGHKIVDLYAASKQQADVKTILAIAEGGDEALALAQEVEASCRPEFCVSTSDVKLLAPIPTPPQMRDCLCFEEHLVNAFQNARKLRASRADDYDAEMALMERDGILIVPKIFYKQPIYYKANRFAVIGTETDVIWPHYSENMDFELEFGCYIGKKTKNVSAEDAKPYIFGYTIFNDFTARDAQITEMAGQLGPCKGKDFDTGNPMGPCLVTADEMKDPYNLKMEVRVNGERWGGGNTSSMYWSFEDLIGHISQAETLYPGEFLGSGTVGTGCGLEQMRFLSDGDVVELEVEGIGILRNRIVK